MRKILIVSLCVALLALPGCKGCGDRRARHGTESGTKPEQSTQTRPTSSQSFRGLDLAKVPRTTRVSELPDVWEERPQGSRSFEIRKDVVCVYSGLDGAVYHVPEKECFYIQYDPLGSSTMTYYGPIEGDPTAVLDLERSPIAEPSAGAASPRRR